MRAPTCFFVPLSSLASNGCPAWMTCCGQASSATSPARRCPAVLARASRWALVLPGLFFGCDNAIWNTSLHMTTVSNSTLFANLAPICVTFFAWLLFRERITRLFLVGLVAALFGASLLMGTGVKFGMDHLIGDLLASGDVAGAQRHAHTLKGTAATLGLGAVSECARELEQCLREGAGAGDPASALARLGDALERAVAEIHRLRQVEQN